MDSLVGTGSATKILRSSPSQDAEPGMPPRNSPPIGKAYFSVHDLDTNRRYKVSMQRDDFRKVKVRKIVKTLSQLAFVDPDDLSLFTADGRFLYLDETGTDFGLDEKTVLLLKRRGTEEPEIEDVRVDSMPFDGGAEGGTTGKAVGTQEGDVKFVGFISTPAASTPEVAARSSALASSEPKIPPQSSSTGSGSPPLLYQQHHQHQQTRRASPSAMASSGQSSPIALGTPAPLTEEQKVQQAALYAEFRRSEGRHHDDPTTPAPSAPPVAAPRPGPSSEQQQQQQPPPSEMDTSQFLASVLAYAPNPLKMSMPPAPICNPQTTDTHRTPTTTFRGGSFDVAPETEKLMAQPGLGSTSPAGYTLSFDPTKFVSAAKGLDSRRTEHHRAERSTKTTETTAPAGSSAFAPFVSSPNRSDTGDAISLMTRHDLLAQWQNECESMAAMWQRDRAEWEAERLKLQRAAQSTASAENEMAEQMRDEFAVLATYAARLESELGAASREIIDLNQRVAQISAEKGIADREATAARGSLDGLMDEIAAVHFRGDALQAEDHINSSFQKELHKRELKKSEKEISRLVSLLTAETEKRKALHCAIEELRGNIRVIVRMRPPIHIEQVPPIPIFDNTKIEVNETQNTVTVSSQTTGARSFEFYRVLGPGARHIDVFAEISPLIQSVIDGCSVTVLAYGQTGSGKTHTILGMIAQNALTGAAETHSLGVLPRAVALLFSELNSMCGEASGFHAKSDAATDAPAFAVHCTVVELYNDVFRDLVPDDIFHRDIVDIVPQVRSKVLSGRCELHTVNGVSRLIGAREHCVRTPDEALTLLSIGGSSRQTQFTRQNAMSSRSHAIFTFTIHLRRPERHETQTSRLVFVDLAGSERIAKSQSTGERLVEAQRINKSLAALGDVVAMLSKHQTGECSDELTYVPYRNSKLTLLLQNSIGGTSKTVMVACIAPNYLPYESNTSETLSTLQFASRVRCIRNAVRPMAAPAATALSNVHIDMQMHIGRPIISQASGKTPKRGASPGAKAPPRWKG